MSSFPSDRWRFPCALALLVALAVGVRALPGIRQVFVPGAEPSVRLREMDPWYHLRAVEHQVANFPERFRFDPALRHPGGDDVPVAPLLDWVTAVAALVAGLGSPTPREIARLAAWMPPLLAGLTLLPAAAFARRRWGALPALAAAAAVAVLPGQFLARSLLGFFDHHVLEVLLTTATLAALAAGLAAAPGRGTRRRAALGAGSALGLYLLAWVGGAALVALLAAWVGLQYAIDVARRRSLDWLPGVVVPAAAIALLPVALLYDGVTVPQRNLIAAFGLLLGSGLLAVAERATRPLLASRAAALLAPLVVLGVLFATLAVTAPGLVAGLGQDLLRLLPGAGGDLRVSEAAPWLARGPLWSTTWEELGATGYLLPVAALAWLGSGVARGRREDLLLAVWTLGLLAMTFAQNRFAYYLVVPAGFGVAWGLDRLLALARGEGELAAASLGRGLVAAGVAASLLLPTLGATWSRAGAPVELDADWIATLAWLRAATPAPFADARDWLRPATRRQAERPRSAYGVLAWWDYGYWILELARRVPIANPTQAGATEAAKILLATEDGAAVAAAERLGARYLLIDDSLPVLVRRNATRATGKIRALMAWAGEPSERFLESVRAPAADGSKAPRTLFYPDYYRTLLVRLYLFGGRGYEPRGPAYVAELAPLPAGAPPELVRVIELSSFAAAGAWLADKDPLRFRLVGLDPAVPCVPLPASPAFVRRFGSPTPALSRDGEPVGRVEAYEILAAAAPGSAP